MHGAKHFIVDAFFHVLQSYRFSTLYKNPQMLAPTAINSSKNRWNRIKDIEQHKQKHISIDVQQVCSVRWLSKVLNYSDVAKWNRERRGVDKFREDRADGVCWTYTITLTFTHTQTSAYRHTTHWWHNSSMPGVWLVACSLALSGSRAECVSVYVLSLCERGPLFTTLCCQLGTKSQGKMVHTHTYKQANTHNTLCCLFLSSLGRKLKEVKAEYRGKDTNEGQQQFLAEV